MIGDDKVKKLLFYIQQIDTVRQGTGLNMQDANDVANWLQLLDNLEAMDTTQYQVFRDSLKTDISKKILGSIKKILVDRHSPKYEILRQALNTICIDLLADARIEARLQNKPLGIAVAIFPNNVLEITKPVLSHQFLDFMQSLNEAFINSPYPSITYVLKPWTDLGVKCIVLQNQRLNELSDKDWDYFLSIVFHSDKEFQIDCTSLAGAKGQPRLHELERVLSARQEAIRRRNIVNILNHFKKVRRKLDQYFPALFQQVPFEQQKTNFLTMWTNIIDICTKNLKSKQRYAAIRQLHPDFSHPQYEDAVLMILELNGYIQKQLKQHGQAIIIQAMALDYCNLHQSISLLHLGFNALVRNSDEEELILEDIKSPFTLDYLSSKEIILFIKMLKDATPGLKVSSLALYNLLRVDETDLPELCDALQALNLKNLQISVESIKSLSIKEIQQLGSYLSKIPIKKFATIRAVDINDMSIEEIQQLGSYLNKLPIGKLTIIDDQYLPLTSEEFLALSIGFQEKNITSDAQTSGNNNNEQAAEENESLTSIAELNFVLKSSIKEYTNEEFDAFVNLVSSMGILKLNITDEQGDKYLFDPEEANSLYTLITQMEDNIRGNVVRSKEAGLKNLVARMFWAEPSKYQIPAGQTIVRELQEHIARQAQYGFSPGGNASGNSG